MAAIPKTLWHKFWDQAGLVDLNIPPKIFRFVYQSRKNREKLIVIFHLTKNINERREKEKGKRERKGEEGERAIREGERERKEER